MILGAPKETKQQEYRVGLVPRSVQLLVRDGHEVWIETGAGHGIGASDQDYQAAGANIAADAETLFDRVELIVKVKEPNSVERALLKPGHTLFTYLHLASDPEQTHELVASNAVCIAYETVTDTAGGLPLLTPMSEIAGRVAVQEAVTHLNKHNGGMGVLIGGASGVEAESVVIIGGGVVGTNSAQIALGLGANVTILDRSVPRLTLLDRQFQGRANCILSTPESIEKYVRQAAMVIGAVLIPGGKAARLISSELVKKMRPGAVIADVAIDQGGCCENSRPTTHAEPTFIVDDVIHYCVANIPGAVPRTSSTALNHATLPYIRELASKGSRRAMAENPHLLNGLNVCRGLVTQDHVADDLGLPYTPAEQALGQIQETR